MIVYLLLHKKISRSDFQSVLKMRPKITKDLLRHPKKLTDWFFMTTSPYLSLQERIEFAALNRIKVSINPPEVTVRPYRKNTP